MATRLFFGRPRDRSVEAYREFVLEAYRGLTGKTGDDPYSPEQWAKKCRAFWAPAKGSRKKDSGPDNQRLKEKI
jgi:hypothetical protein